MGMKIVTRGWDEKQLVPEGRRFFQTWHTHNTVFNRRIILGNLHANFCVPEKI